MELDTGFIDCLFRRPAAEANACVSNICLR
jgi:hypothetical protein